MNPYAVDTGEDKKPHTEKMLTDKTSDKKGGKTCNSCNYWKSLLPILGVLAVFFIGINCITFCERNEYTSKGVNLKLDSIRRHYREMASLEKDLIDLDNCYYSESLSNIAIKDKKTRKNYYDNKRDSLLQRGDKIQKELDGLLVSFEEANNAVMDAKLDEIDRNITLWVSILCGVATIVALACSISQFISYKEIKEELLKGEEEIKTRQEELNSEIEQKTEEFKNELTVYGEKTHALNTTQILWSINSLRSFNRKDSFIYDDKECIDFLMNRAITKIEKDLKISQDGKGEGVEHQGELLILLLNQTTKLIDEYLPFFKSPSAVKNLNQKKGKLNDLRRKLCDKLSSIPNLSKEEKKIHFTETETLLLETKNIIVDTIKEVKYFISSLNYKSSSI